MCKRKHQQITLSWERMGNFIWVNYVAWLKHSEKIWEQVCIFCHPCADQTTQKCTSSCSVKMFLTGSCVSSRAFSKLFSMNAFYHIPAEGETRETSCNTVKKTSLIPEHPKWQVSRAVGRSRAALGTPLEQSPGPFSAGAAPGTGSCELAEWHKIQRTHRTTSKIFMIVHHLSARQIHSKFVSAAPLETRGVKHVPTTTSHPRTGWTAATQVFFSPLCQK